MDYRFHKEVTIPVRNVELRGELVIPLKAEAIVIFSHGSGSSRLSPRNQMVAKSLHEKNFGTLLFDLLTANEDKYYENRFDIELLTRRLTGATLWLEKFPVAKDCRTGYFGASTGAASALKAATYLSQISAIVSRGGRPDLVMENLPDVTAPTLLIVGSLDFDVLKLNKEAYIQLGGDKKLEVVEGATHLFEETGMMEKETNLAVSWFEKHLQPVLAR
jgi:predicted alpha/beta-hydrolase family hydrolase